MSSQADGSSPAVKSIWNRLIYNVRTSKDAEEEALTDSAVERQTENSRKGGTIWQTLLKADKEAMIQLVKEDAKHVDARGPVGECPIHMLFLYGSDTHIAMAQYLIQNFSHTITQIYNGSEYYGENVLHIAIIKRNVAMVEWLLGDENNQPYQEQQLTASASGNFFKFGRPCYYGETPLAFACCTNQWNVAEILLKYGASMDATDSNGNNVLHLLVIHNLPKMYTKFKQRWIEVQAAENEESDDDEDAKLYKNERKVTPLWKRLNKDGYTPLTLAAKLGLKKMFSFLLKERKITQWSYGPVACVLYPLDQVDLEIPADDDGNDNNEDRPAGALELIVKNAHVKLIMHPRLIDLVNKKWERFARRIFFNRFLVAFAYLSVFLITTILDQSRIETVEGDGEDAVVTRIEPPGMIFQSICAVGRMFVLFGAIWKGWSEYNEMQNLGLKKYFQTTGSGLLENCLSCLFCLSIYIVNILRVFDMQAEQAMLAVASIFGWGYMLFFVMAFRLTGPFVVMIYEMLFNDVLRFFIIYIVFLAGFSQAFFILFDNNGFSGFLVSVKQSFLGMLGDFDLDAYTETSYRYISVSLLVFYIIVVTILLLNLLIAMMGDTYGNIIEDATQIWHLERARIVFAIENEMTAKERDSPANKYWTNIDDERYLQVEEIDKKCFRGDDDDEEEKEGGGDDDGNEDDAKEPDSEADSADRSEGQGENEGHDEG